VDTPTSFSGPTTCRPFSTPKSFLANVDAVCSRKDRDIGPVIHHYRTFIGASSETSSIEDSKSSRVDARLFPVLQQPDTGIGKFLMRTLFRER